MNLIALFLILFCFQAQTQAEELTQEQATEKSPWAHESEASLVQVGGNTESESYSAKQKTDYTFGLNTLTAAGRYLQTKSGSTETAKAWEASLRYERSLSDSWAAFVQRGAESNFYAGYVQRDNSDLGAKYIFWKNDSSSLTSEVGVRDQVTLAGGLRYSATMGRLYVEYNTKMSDSVSGKFWAEYLPNFDDTKAWLVNYEPSLSVMLSSIFSLKTSYLVKQANIVEPGAKNEDTTLTTSIVAKF